MEDTIYAMDVYCTLYNIVGDISYGSDGKADTSKMGKYNVSFEWDDSILVDVESELNTRIVLYDKGVESQLGLRMWYFGETEAQAQDALNKIAEERQANIENNMMMSSQMGQQIRDEKGEEKGDQKDEKEDKNSPNNGTEKKNPFEQKQEESPETPEEDSPK